MMIFVGISLIVVTGLNLLFGYAGQISLAHATFFGIGAYSSAVSCTKLAWNPWIGMAVGILVAAFLALIVGLPSLKLTGYYLAMATLGFGVIVEILFIQLVPLTGGPDGIGGIPSLSIFGFRFNSDFRFYYLVWVIAALFCLIVMNLVNSKVGRNMRALHESELAAKVLGIDTFRYKLKIFIFSAVYAAIGGSLFAHYISHITPESFGIMHSISFVAMTIIGGMGKIWGPFLGACIITILPEALMAFEAFHVIIYGGIIVLILMFFEEGMVGLINVILGKVSIRGKKWYLQ